MWLMAIIERPAPRASALSCGPAIPPQREIKDYDWFLAVLFPADQLQILPYNRVVKDLNGHSPEAFLQAVARPSISNLTARPNRPSPARFECISAVRGMISSGSRQLMPTQFLNSTFPPCRIASWRQSSALTIRAPASGRLYRGIRGTDELVRLVDSGKAAVAFSMFPTTVEQLMAIADAGQIMPPKSTWFEPKLRSGLFIHTF
jgi:hypothetical protein